MNEFQLPPLLPRNGRCQARLKRSRKYCPRWGMENGRCYVHGGATPKLVTILAKTKSEYLPREVYARFESLNGNVIDNLEESVRIQQTLETSIIERLKTGESALAWEKLTELVGSMSFLEIEMPSEDEDETVTLAKRIDKLEGFIQDIRNLVLAGQRSFAIQSELRSELQRAHENQRKMTETLVKCRKEVQETYTEEEWNTLLLRILTSLKKNVDAQTLALIVADFQAMEPQKLLRAKAS